MTRAEFDRLYSAKKRGAATEAEIAALEPYKVKNAVIMAAGTSSRFVPLSLEVPKGLLTVKGEVLIERQIRQLLEAGIDEIVVVLGYKKESFFYLAEKYGVILIENPEYNVKNNVYTLYAARRYLSATYVCSSDNYFTSNPFEEYVYRSYYAAQHVPSKVSEWYMIPDGDGNIAAVTLDGDEGDVMLGHVFWDRRFSAAMLGIIEADRSVGHYDALLWEQILADRVKDLPPMEIRVYPDGTILEFDSLDDLRAFDASYVDDTRSKIAAFIAKKLGCREGDLSAFRLIRFEDGEASFTFEAEGRKYVCRHDSDGDVISEAG